MPERLPPLPHKGARPAAVHDPHAEREASRYERPIPSREAILALLERSGELMLAASASSNEVGYLTHKVARSLGLLAFDNQARV